MGEKSDYIIVTCPHCRAQIFIYKREFNCKIFRHGVYKKNMKQIDPHLKKSECDRLKEKDLIYGCGKPYRLVETEDNKKIILKAVICSYI